MQRRRSSLSQDGSGNVHRRPCVRPRVCCDGAVAKHLMLHERRESLLPSCSEQRYTTLHPCEKNVRKTPPLAATTGTSGLFARVCSSGVLSPCPMSETIRARAKTCSTAGTGKKKTKRLPANRGWQFYQRSSPCSKLTVRKTPYLLCMFFQFVCVITAPRCIVLVYRRR